jgi:nucleotide-binding universal stress UspA family protein
MFRHILVPLDGSTRAEQALPLAARIAHFSGGTLTLLRVVMPPIYVDAFSTQLALSEAIAAESGKYIKDDIEGFDGSDIIALATHGRSGLSRLVLGSVTEYILETTKLPLLVVRPSEQATQETAHEKEPARRTPQEEYAIRIGLS